MANGPGTLKREVSRPLVLIVEDEPDICWAIRAALAGVECDVTTSLAHEEPIAQLKARVGALPYDETVAERVAVGQMVQAALDRRRAALRDLLLPPLRKVAVDVAINPPMDDGMVANVALLLDREGRRGLDRAVETLDERFGGRLTFRCVGPLPPYSFATVEVQVPSFEEVDGARRLLGLGERATVHEIRRAYRRMAAELHPDRNPDDPDAEGRMASLSQAYRLLMAYAESHEMGKAGEECDFSRSGVEGTLLIAIRRQEAVDTRPSKVEGEATQ
jgi:hypothetical protein